MGRRYARNMDYSVKDGIVTATNNNNGISFIFDEQDLEAVSQYSWTLGKTGYVTTHVRKSSPMFAGKVRLFVHRVILDVPEDMQVDHKDGNPLNNRRCNIRICNSEQNGKNKKIKSDNTSGYKGVRYNPWNATNPWTANIVYFEDGISKAKQVGSYPTAEAAARGYNAAALKYHGEFARLNNVPDETVAEEARKLVEMYVKRGNPYYSKLFNDVICKLDNSDTDTAVEALQTMAKIVQSFEKSAQVVAV